jgi:hypothetical protein
MAGTYGEPGKTEFQLKNIVGKYSIVVNPETKISQIYQRKSQFDFQSIGTLNLATNQLTFDQNAPLTRENKSDLSKNIDTFRKQSVVVATVGGATNAEELLLGNSEQAPGSPTANPENPGEITDEKPGDAPGLTDLSENFRDKNEFNNIKKFLYYPNTILSNGQDKLLISQYSYVPAPITSGGVESVQSNLTNRNTQFTEWLGTVTLPIPNDLSEMNQVGWGEDNLSGITASLMGAGTGIVKDLSGFDAQGLIGQFENLGGILGSTAVKTRLKQFLTASTSAEILKKIGINVNPEAYINRVTGAAINTNLELLFNGPKLRPFSLSFKMSPRNKDEAQNIRSIIKFLKKGMSPKRSKNSDVMYFLGSPNVFKIKFTKGESTLDDPLNIKDLDSIGRFKTCALVSCGVNYTPDGVYASFNDPIVGSQPIAVLVTLSFIELTPIFNDEYEDSSTIGPERINEKFEYQESTN